MTRKAVGCEPSKTDDVFALGVIWYQLVTGDIELVSLPADWWKEVRDRGMPEHQVELLESCLAGKAENRPEDAMELAYALRKLIKNQSWSRFWKALLHFCVNFIAIILVVVAILFCLVPIAAVFLGERR